MSDVFERILAGVDDGGLEVMEDLHPEIVEIRDVMDRVFRSPDGRRVLTFLRDFCRASRPSYLPGASTEDALYFEGRRSVMIFIQEYLDLDDEQLRQEAQSRNLRSVR